MNWSQAAAGLKNSATCEGSKPHSATCLGSAPSPQGQSRSLLLRLQFGGGMSIEALTSRSAHHSFVSRWTCVHQNLLPLQLQFWRLLDWGPKTNEPGRIMRERGPLVKNQLFWEGTVSIDWNSIQNRVFLKIESSANGRTALGRYKTQAQYYLFYRVFFNLIFKTNFIRPIPTVLCTIMYTIFLKIYLLTDKEVELLNTT